MKLSFRSLRARVVLFTLLAFTLGVLAAGCGGGAKKYPSEPVRFIVGFKVGGVTDVRIRALQPFLQENLGVTAVVENMDGSAGAIAADFVKKQKPDGYNLLVVQMPNAVALKYTAGQNYDYAKDFTPIYAFSAKDFNFLSVRPDSPMKNMQDVIKTAQEKKTTVALAGYGSNAHMMQAMLADAIKPKEMVIVPCASSTESMTQLVGGHVDFAITATGGAVFQMLKENKARAIGIAATERLEAIKDVPTFKEQNVNVAMEGAFGVVGPPNMPKDVVKVLEDAFTKSLKNEKAIDAFKKAGVVPATIGAEEFTKMINEWQKLADQVAPLLKATMEGEKKK